MELKLVFQKALLHLDRQEFVKAEVLLREIILNAEAVGNTLLKIQSLVCFGDLLFSLYRFEESVSILEEALALSLHDDYDDVLEFEISRAHSLLNEMKSE